MKTGIQEIQLLTLHLDGWHSELKVSLTLLALTAFIVGLAWLLFVRLSRLSVFGDKDVQLDIKLGNVGTVKIKPNNEVRQIAHKAWTELVTRKAGVAVDRQNDVIADVYKSWYELFKEIRLLIREVPAQKLKNDDTKKLVDVLIKTLNEGLRPHLTLWQAQYRRWYDNAVEQDKKAALTPQDIQRKYSKYDDLVDDMLKVNGQLVEYAAELKKLLD